MIDGRRRLLNAALGGAAIASLPRYVRAQTRPKRIGFLWNGHEADPVLVQRVAVFKAAMRDAGYTDGRDYVLEQRFAGNDLSRLPALARELVGIKADAIVTGGNQTVVAARDATREIPIVTTVSANLVRAGLVKNLSRPGGNITGLTNFGSELYGKRLELLQQIVPGLRRLGLLQDMPTTSMVTALEPVTRKLGLQVMAASIERENVDAAFKALQHAKSEGVLVRQGSVTIALKQSIAQHAAAYRLPAVYPLTVFTEAGGLASYSTHILDLYRRVPAYLDKIFKGANPGELPIEQPIKFELVVNMKAAKGLGVTIPQSILLQADRVIE